jgi:glycerophosphoryl diester phosphodiesterase
VGRYGSTVVAHRVLISAHRCGFTELGEVDGTEDPVAGIAHSAAVGADYCEFDVRRCTDGVFVIAHDPDLGDDPIRTLDWPSVHSRAPEVLRLDQLLAALAATDMGAHVDVKFETSGRARRDGESWEADLLAVLTDGLPADRIVMTTGRRSATRAMRSWAVERRSGVLVGMSIGSSIRGLSWSEAVRRLWGEVFPHRRFADSHADAVAAHYALAILRLSRWTRKIGVPLLVWTVDSPRLQRRLLHDPRIWMITTNRPAQAFVIREGHPR